MPRTDDPYFYDLPRELIAQAPLPERSASRLLRLPPGTGCEDRLIRELPDLLQPGDLLVFNDTRVVPARLIAHKSTGGRVEVLLERPLEGNLALVQIKGGASLRNGAQLDTAGGRLGVAGREGEFWRVRLPDDALPFFMRWGEVPLPPYIQRPPNEEDRDRYQSVFARVDGAVAAPTASLHFDAALLEALERRGIERTFVTLHVGAGTFQPPRLAADGSSVLHPERMVLSAEACGHIARARARGGRVVAVGTTVARALETAALEQDARGGALQPYEGETRLFIRPGHRFRAVDSLLTNLHLPGSSLLMLVCAFAGRERVLAAYAHAVRQRYRFFSYGDAMLSTAAHQETS